MKNLKEIMPMTKEYAGMLNTLVVNAQGSMIEEYLDLFMDLFSNVSVASSFETGLDEWKKSRETTDVILIYINEQNDAVQTFLRALRTIDEEVAIYIILPDMNIKYFQLLISIYDIDGILPFPFHTNSLYRYLYHVTKRVLEAKQSATYLQQLEIEEARKLQAVEHLSAFIDELKNTERFNVEVARATLESIHCELMDCQAQVSDAQTTSLKIASHDQMIMINSKNNVHFQKQLENMRLNRTDTIDAVTFVSNLDSTLADKIESFFVYSDELIMRLYDLEDADGEGALIILTDIADKLEDFSGIIESIGSFQNRVNSLNGLITFLKSLDAYILEDTLQKSLMSHMMLDVVKDLEKWIQTIFLEQEADDIHYYDASFANDCLEIEALFSNEEVDTSAGREDLSDIVEAGIILM
jgi:hypothetical protein